MRVPMQSILYTILITLSSSIVFAIIVYIFKIRQLYLVQINFFDYGNIQSRDEKILEFKIINKSKFVEEEIIVTLPMESCYELIGSDCANIIIDQNQIKLSRLPKLTEISILILAKDFSKSSNISPEITSKTTKGRTITKISDVPLTYGDLFIATVLVITFFVGTIYGTDYYIEYKKNTEILQKQETNKKTLARFAHLKSMGWGDEQIIKYAASDLSKLYSDYELPITIRKIEENGKRITVIFFINNKTIFDFNVTISLPQIDNKDVQIKNLRYDKANVAPNSSQEAISEFEITKGEPQNIIYTTFISFNNEILRMEFTANIKK